MGIGRCLLSKTLRCCVPWALVVVPVAVLLVSFLALVAANDVVVVDLAGLIFGTLSFSIGMIYIGIKHEKAIEDEAL